ncbi:MAG: hypothetical protein JSU81_10055 [Candidatus Coatesbacteria bacterium]|nr:MAG: hypothetical protein JSU81_10055 [Candidatus Coatesbacteria bacterium]
MNWKLILRPIGLPAFLISLVFLPFFPVVTAVGAAAYASAIYWAYHRERNKALPPGTVDAVGKLPYRRRKLANLALAAARDIERRLALFPPDLAERMPLTAPDAGRLAAAVVYYLREEAQARELAAAGGGRPAQELAAAAAGSAERTFGRIQQLQHALGALALASANVDRDMLTAEAETATAEIKALRRAMEEARAELAAAPERPALEGEIKPPKGGEGD